MKYRKNLARTGNSNNFINEIGQRYGKLTVIAEGENYRNDACWVCRCDCGSTVTVRGFSLRRRDTKSCGCIQKETTANRNRLSANPKKEELRNKAFDLRNSGLSFGQIADQFTKQGVPTLSGKESSKWYASTIKWLLTNNLE
ncbi:recombinase family protein [Microcoleus sp. B3-D7]|uniref:recombinase family protein n=1 Tax=Microcoleus sp. B3-D7 TaxID=2818659 RepID=UPI002FD530C1